MGTPSQLSSRSSPEPSEALVSSTPPGRSDWPMVWNKLDAVASRLLINLCAQAPLLAGADQLT